MEKGTKALLIISSIIALGGLTYFLINRRNLKALNVYSVGKSADGKLYVYFTTKSAPNIVKFLQTASPQTAIEGLDLAKNPNKSLLNTGKTIEIKGIDGLNGKYPVLGVLTPSTNPNRVMAVRIDASSVPASFITLQGANEGRFYAKDASSVGKLIIK